MSQALDLLNSLSAEEIARYTATPANEPHIVINADRTITVPDSLKRIAVQYDHNMETVTFDCPRYWDDHDMSKMIVYINYVLPNNVTGQYIAGNISVDSSDSTMMHFTWTITNEITQYKGNIAFLVCIKKTDGTEEANETNHWNSELNRDLYISEGLECEPGVSQMYPDIVTQLLERMTTVEQINIQADVMEQLLADTQEAAATAEEVKNEALDASNHIKNSYANAIKGNASGDIVRVDDVSPVEHDVKCWVHGKNLIPYPYDHTTRTTAGITFTDNGDGTITASGTATAQAFFNVKAAASAITLPPGTYTFSGTPSGGTGNTYYMYIVDQDQGSFKDYGSTKTFTITEERTYRIFIFINTGVTVTNLTFAPMIETGSIHAEYEPWLDPSNITVGVNGQNLLNIDAMCNDFLTKSDNGLYTFKMGANAGERFSRKIPIHIPAGTTLWMSASFYAFTTSASTLYMIFTYADGTEAYPGITFAEQVREVPLQKDLVAVQFYLQGYEEAGAYLTFRKPQFEIGSAPTPYKPYVESESGIPSVDGTVPVKSVSPAMTVFTDTPGVTVDIEYNVNTNTLIDALIARINALETEVNSVRFSIGGQSYTVKKGTTWAEFLSDNNVTVLCDNCGNDASIYVNGTSVSVDGSCCATPQRLAYFVEGAGEVCVNSNDAIKAVSYYSYVG